MPRRVEDVVGHVAEVVAEWSICPKGDQCEDDDCDMDIHGWTDNGEFSNVDDWLQKYLSRKVKP